MGFTERVRKPAFDLCDLGKLSVRKRLDRKTLEVLGLLMCCGSSGAPSPQSQSRQGEEQPARRLQYDESAT